MKGYSGIRPKDTEINQQTFKLRVLIAIQSTQDKGFSCLLCTALFTFLSIMSSMVLKLHMAVAIFLDIICSHEFIRGYPFFYFYCAGMSKHNH